MKIQLVTLMLCLVNIASADQWIKKADFIGDRSSGVSFSINQKGYVGTGRIPGGLSNDFWCYDPANDSWSQVADLPGAVRFDAFGFEVSGKGYVGCGIADGGTGKEFWQFDVVSNLWIQKADFPDLRYAAVAFSIGSNGYVGTGCGTGPVMNDFWQYNPTSDAWTRKADFIGSARWHAVGFSINGKGYIGTGTDTSANNVQDFYEYNPINDTWTTKSDFTGGPVTRSMSFVIGNFGYVGLGFGNTSMNMELWQYNPIANSWTQKSNFSGSSRSSTMTFTINGLGYVCAGDSILIGASGFQGRSHWQYIPDSLDAIPELSFEEAGIEIFPNPVHDFFNVHTKYPVILSAYTEEGKVLFKSRKCEDVLRIDAHNWAAGIYYLKAELNKQSFVHSLVKD